MEVWIETLVQGRDLAWGGSINKHRRFVLEVCHVRSGGPGASMCWLHVPQGQYCHAMPAPMHHAEPAARCPHCSAWAWKGC